MFKGVPFISDCCRVEKEREKEEPWLALLQGRGRSMENYVPRAFHAVFRHWLRVDAKKCGNKCRHVTDIDFFSFFFNCCVKHRMMYYYTLQSTSDKRIGYI